jgi:hypothetical protein
MTEQQTVTVAGVPVTVQAADDALTVTIGRFDPAAAGPLLHLEHLLPAVGEEHEGQWFLHFADGQRGSYPSAQAA